MLWIVNYKLRLRYWIIFSRVVVSGRKRLDTTILSLDNSLQV